MRPECVKAGSAPADAGEIFCDALMPYRGLTPAGYTMSPFRVPIPFPTRNGWRDPNYLVTGIDMFESKTDRLLPRAEFLKRMARSVGAAVAVVAFSLGIGSAGYHVYGELPWLDALLNASMILTGMGPVDPMRTRAGKL